MSKIRFIIIILIFLPFTVSAQSVENEVKSTEKPLTGWFASGGFKVVYNGQGDSRSWDVGLSAGVGKDLKGWPLALGVQFDYDLRSFIGQTVRPQSLKEHVVRARPFLRTYIFSRGSIGASFDTSVPMALTFGANCAESFTGGVSVSPTAVYFVNRRVTVFMTLSLFELSYSCMVPLRNNGQSAQHRFTAGFLNMGMSGAVMGITWNL